MPLTCNINAKGKAIRLAGGTFLLIDGLVLAVTFAWPTGGWIPWTSASLLAFVGAFMIFEARAGWCAVRAMGFKTRI